MKNYFNLTSFVLGIMTVAFCVGLLLHAVALIVTAVFGGLVNLSVLDYKE
jgi:hypothetical protein